MWEHNFKMQNAKICNPKQFRAHTNPILKTLGRLRVEDIYDLHLLKLYDKIKILSIPQYFYDFANLGSSEKQELRY